MLTANFSHLVCAHFLLKLCQTREPHGHRSIAGGEPGKLDRVASSCPRPSGHLDSTGHLHGSLHILDLCMGMVYPEHVSLRVEVEDLMDRPKHRPPWQGLTYLSDQDQKLGCSSSQIFY